MKTTAIIAVTLLCVTIGIAAQGNSQNKPENTGKPELTTPKTDAPTTQYYDHRREQQKMLRKFIREMVQEKYSGEPLMLHGQAYPRYCFNDDESDHLYIVVPGTKCGQFFQHYPGAGKPTDSRVHSCPAGLMFDVKKCVCVGDKDRSKCETVSVNGQPGPGIGADDLVNEVLSKLKYLNN